MTKENFKMFEIPLPPTTNTCRVPDIKDDLREILLHVIKVNKFLAIRLQDVQDFLDATQAVIQTSIYKNSNRFRNDKAFKGIKMVQRTLQKLKDLGLKEVLKRFSDLMPLPIDIKEPSRKLYLPVDSVLQHFLCVIMQAFLLSERLLGLCEHTKKYLLARIELGHFWNWAVFSFANVSRIWTLSQTVMVNIHLGYGIYNQLLKHLPNSDIKWLPDEIQLPKQLIPFDSALREKETLKKLLTSYDFPAIVIEQPQTDICSNFIGEVIERPVVSNSKATATSKKQWLKLNKALSKVNSIEDVKNFMKLETDQRQKCRKEALTKKMEQTEWKALKAKIKVNLSEDISVPLMRLTLLYYITCPQHKGTHCQDVKDVELRLK